MSLHKAQNSLLSLLFAVRYYLTELFQRKSSDFPVTANYYPSGLGIEVTNLCNANCIFCAYQYQKRPVTFMSYEMFRKAIDQYLSFGKDKDGVGLTPVVGDPLVDRDLVRK